MILSVRAEDVGPFTRSRPLAVDLEAPTVCVTGDNGSGKTTLVNLLAYLFSGDPAWVRRAASLDAGEEANPFAEVRFVPDGADWTEYTLGRSIPSKRKARRKLEGGGKKWGSESEIAGELERWYGMPPKAFAEYSFVPQGELAAVVAADPAVRRKALGRLLGLDHAERVWDALGQDARVVVAGGEGLAQARARCAESAAKVVTARDAARKAGAVSEESLRRVQKHAAALEARAGVAETRSRLTREVAEIDGQLEVERAGAERLAKWFNDLAARAKPLQERAAAGYGKRRRADVLRDVARARARLDQAVQPDPGAPMVEHPVLAAARGEVGMWRQLVALPAGGDCPTCRRPVDETLARLVADAKEKIAAFEEADGQWSRYCKYHAEAVRLYQDDRAERERTHADLARWLVELGSLPEGVDEAAAEYARLRPEIEQAEQRAQAAAARVVSLTTEARAKREALAALPEAADPAEVKAARDAADTLHGQYLAAQGAAADLVAAEAAYAADRRLVTQLEEGEARTAQAKAWAGRATRVRDAFHRDAAPAALVGEYVQSLEDDLNDWLSRFRAPFRARAVDDTGFEAHFADRSTPVPAELLSGGQKLVLAWAWVAARQARHGDRLWLLCLDEPTYGFDEKRSTALREAVDGWRHAAAGRQLILVTHDRRLAACCDKVVELV